MDVRRVGEALLRSHPTNLVSDVLRPSQQQCSRFLFNRSSSGASRHISESSRRTFSTLTSRLQQNAPKDDAPPSQQSAQKASPSSSQEPPQIIPLDGLRNFLNNAPNRSGTSAEITRRPADDSSNEGGQRQGKSLFALDTSKKTLWASSSVEDAGAKHIASQAKAKPQAMALRQMLGHTVLDRRTAPQRAMWHFPHDGVAQMTTKQALMEPPDVANLPRLGPSYGRTVPIENGDLVGALRRMDIRINTNGIRKAFYAQKFHERPGLKRKRLASQRWRYRFMQGFKATVKTVQHLKRQGW